MRLNEIAFEGQRPVDGYGPGGFRIGGAWIEGSLILLPAARHAFEGPPSVEALAPLLAAAGEVDVVLVGQGAEIRPLAPALRVAIETAGPGVETMSTPSACRTYNVLLAEQRRVAAVLVAL